MRNTMEKTLRQEDMGGGDLKENVFGMFMNVFFVLPVKITYRVVTDITYKRVGVIKWVIKKADSHMTDVFGRVL